MSADVLLDSNVLLYAISSAWDEQEKRAKARELLRLPGAGFSTQVFAEFYDNAIRKQKPRLTHSQALAILDPLRDLPVQPLTVAVVWEAFRIRERFRISYWDAAILSAAKSLGCRKVFSEDLSDGQDYDGVAVVNPFRGL